MSWEKKKEQEICVKAAYEKLFFETQILMRHESNNTGIIFHFCTMIGASKRKIIITGVMRI